MGQHSLIHTRWSLREWRDGIAMVCCVMSRAVGGINGLRSADLAKV